MSPKCPRGIPEVCSKCKNSVRPDGQIALAAEREASSAQISLRVTSASAQTLHGQRPRVSCVSPMAPSHVGDEPDTSGEETPTAWAEGSPAPLPMCICSGWRGWQEGLSGGVCREEFGAPTLGLRFRQCTHAQYFYVLDAYAAREGEGLDHHFCSSR